jgi:hypothetical protein
MPAHFRMLHRRSAICHERREELRLRSSTLSAIWHRFTGMLNVLRRRLELVRRADFVSQGVSVPRRGPSKVLARIWRDCRNVCFRCNGLCTGACLVPQVHPLKALDTTHASQRDIMIIIQIDALQQFPLISETLYVTSSTSAQALPIRADEMLLGSHVCLGDPNGGLVRPMRERSGQPSRRRWCFV